MANRNSPSFPQNAARSVFSLTTCLPPLILTPHPHRTFTYPIPDSIPFQIFWPFVLFYLSTPLAASSDLVTGKHVFIPHQECCECCADIICKPPGSFAHCLLTYAPVCHQAALARCAADCVPRQPNGEGTIFMTVTVYLFHHLILCA